ncbi:PD-(D/E)XK nuclease family protein [Ornithinibacillus halophilus]|uniref:PD-(D/E)XK nuclease superfamily protein n=1 Tax=Ornithinibacillus halophilus TaxID=930117 RepID=A0A1M5NN11_9BACI|nr:PD-(D/E)XK nuclease family protein [Ornithinibacillus halophilus]SHG90936.1 PD-(D/E)XK nuclease superfamily protein [Ornithinibacillus halophilus]
MFEIRTYPEFSWSLSRHKTLLDCSRKYYYDYYAGHNGWLYESTNFAKTAYRLKKLTNLEMYFGSAVHNVINGVINNYMSSGSIPTEHELVGTLRGLLNTAYIDSMHRKEDWMHKPKQYTMFHEIYYNGKLPSEKIEEIQDRLAVSMKHFLSSKTFSDMTGNKQMRFIESERFRTMTINGTKIFIVMDFVYRDMEKGKWIIVDWKTGKESIEDKNQLALYAHYLMRAFDVDSLDEIEIRNEYLLTGTSKTHHLTETELSNVERLFEHSVEGMLRFLEDPEKNKPYDLHSFPKNEQPRLCSRCNYKEMCDMY